MRHPHLPPYSIAEADAESESVAGASAKETCISRLSSHVVFVFICCCVTQNKEDEKKTKEAATAAPQIAATSAQEGACCTWMHFKKFKQVI